RPPARPSPRARTESLLGRNRRLLPGPPAPARSVLRGRRPPDGAYPGCPRGPALAVEAPPRSRLGRVLGLDGRHAAGPVRVPATRGAEARPGLPPGADRGRLRARLRGGSGPGHLPVR